MWSMFCLCIVNSFLCFPYLGDNVPIFNDWDSSRWYAFRYFFRFFLSSFCCFFSWFQFQFLANTWFSPLKLDLTSLYLWSFFMISLNPLFLCFLYSTVLSEVISIGYVIFSKYSSMTFNVFLQHISSYFLPCIHCF